MSIHLVIPAAGSSSRFGGDVPKQFVDYKGRPLILHTLDAFSELDMISCTIAVSSAFIDDAKDILKSAKQEITLVEGGKTRADSVKNAVLSLTTEAPVLIHDAARPFVSKEIISRVIGALNDHEAVIPGIACSDTIKIVKNNVVEKTLIRDDLRRIQTPQGFHLSLLKRAYKEVTNFADITDEAGLLERLAIMPTVVDGDEKNIKITFQDDLLR